MKAGRPSFHIRARWVSFDLNELYTIHYPLGRNGSLVPKSLVYISINKIQETKATRSEPSRKKESRVPEETADEIALENIEANISDSEDCEPLISGGNCMFEELMAEDFF